MRFPLALTLATAVGCSHVPTARPPDLLTGMLEGDEATLQALRAQGPSGLLTVLAALEAATNEADRARLREAATRVALQKDAHVSHLYWYDSLDTALAAAKKSGRPVLSLRMLGRLDQELSCANSRFFRTTLYANAEVSAYLREHFVLHWSSERPVPVATIDFGDGRKVTRTLTGNSIHYVLDTRGRVVDALPGLYGAQAFVAALARAEPIARLSGQQQGLQRVQTLRTWHEAQLAESYTRFAGDLRRAGVTAIPGGLPVLPGLAPSGPRPSSRAAVPIAVGKAVVESPMINRLVPQDGPPSPEPVDPTPWQVLASMRLAESGLDASSRALVLSKNPVDVTAPHAPRLGPELAGQLIQRLENNIALDTARNEYALHPVIHRWLAVAPEMSLSGLNTDVYARLFLTPASDPWLGLVPALTWTGLPGDGIEVTRR